MYHSLRKRIYLTDQSLDSVCLLVAIRWRRPKLFLDHRKLRQVAGPQKANRRVKGESVLVLLVCRVFCREEAPDLRKCQDRPVDRASRKDSPPV